MHGVHDDARARQALRPQPREHDLGALRARVRDGAVERAALHLQVVDVQALRIHPARRDVDDPRRRTAAQPPEQQLRQQKRRGDVGGERQLEPVGRHGPLRRQHAGVVDQHVEPRLACQELGREPAHVAEVAEVAPHDFDVAVAGALDNLRARLLAALGAAGQQPDARTEARESRGRGQTEARGRAAHVRHATVHRLELGVAPGVPAQPIAEVRVAREHGGVEAPVEHVVQRVAQSDHGYAGWSVPAKTCQASADFASRLNSM